MAKEVRPSIYFLAISLLILLYLCFYLVPYADHNGFFNENETPDNNKVSTYVMLSAPIVIGYVVYTLIYCKKIKIIKSLNYPLIVTNVYLGSVLCLLSFGGAILWVVMPTLLFPLAALPTSFIFGLIKDIQYIKKNRNKSSQDVI